MGRAGLPLTGRFLAVYTSIALFGFYVVTAYNIFVVGLSWQDLEEFNLIVVAFQVVILVALLMLLTYARLWPAWKYFGNENSKLDVTFIRRRLLNFPTGIFLFTVLFGLVAGPAYHLLDYWYTDAELMISGLIYEQTLSLTIAILLFVSCRRLVRPYILALPQEGLSEIQETSLLRPLIISFGSVMLMTTLHLLNYVMIVTLEGIELKLSVLFSIAGFNLIFAFIIFLLPLLEFQGELKLLIAGMGSLIQGERANLHNKMPVLSLDEVGQLGLSFNVLQERIAKEYEEVEKELQLAFQVQQRLLPSTYYEISNCQIAAFCRPGKEVGGDFYDVIKLDEGNFAVMIGDVSGKGLSAALLMSAVLVLLRHEVRSGGRAGEVLTRLNKTIEETVKGEMFITLGLGFFKPDQGILEYASAGHFPPYMLRNDQSEEIFVSSLPLGVDADEVYEQREIPVQLGDRWFFYTDGIIESAHGKEMVQFTELVRHLTKLDEGVSVREQLKILEQRLPVSNNSQLDDDRTLVMLKINGVNLDCKNFVK